MTASQTSTEPSDTAHLRAGRTITFEETGMHLSSVAVLLRQLAYAMETPTTAVECVSSIDSFRRIADEIAKESELFTRLAAIVEGDVPVATTFLNGDPWGAAARGSDRDDFGGPAIIPTVRQLSLLADIAAKVTTGETTTNYKGDTITLTTYPEAMSGVLHAGWESKAAAERRRRERAVEIDLEVLRVPCGTCEASDGEECRTKTGRLSEQPHRGRLKEATANVDARLGYLGDNPVHVDTD